VKKAVKQDGGRRLPGTCFRVVRQNHSAERHLLLLFAAASRLRNLNADLAE
jgi:hypothetical protein